MLLLAVACSGHGADGTPAVGRLAALVGRDFAVPSAEDLIARGSVVEVVATNPPAPAPPVTEQPPPPPPRDPCRPTDPLLGVPDPGRYEVVQSCLTVTGRVWSVVITDIGGYTVTLAPDDETTIWYLEEWGASLQLQMVPVLCRSREPGPPCGSFAAGLPVLNAPRQNMLIRARGPLVIDRLFERAEINPLEHWELIPEA